MFYSYLSEAIMWQVEFDQVGEVRQSIRVDGGDTTEGEGILDCHYLLLN